MTGKKNSIARAANARIAAASSMSPRYGGVVALRCGRAALRGAPRRDITIVDSHSNGAFSRRGTFYSEAEERGGATRSFRQTADRSCTRPTELHYALPHPREKGLTRAAEGRDFPPENISTPPLSRSLLSRLSGADFIDNQIALSRYCSPSAKTSLRVV